jgi:hypothetical protein
MFFINHVGRCGRACNSVTGGPAGTLRIWREK